MLVADRTGRPARTSRARAWAASSWREAAPFLALTVVALSLRLVGLGDKPLHHDESEHAWFAWRFTNGQGYKYDPVFHGPVQFYLVSLADLVLGATDAVARAAPALAGTVATLLPFFLRRQLGRVAALTAAAALCISPSYLYFSRFSREDIYVACVTLGLIVILLRFFDAPRRWHPTAFLGLLAVSFATKETTYITVFVIGSFVAGTLAVQGVRSLRHAGRIRDTGLVRAATSLGFDAWAWGVSTFLVVYTLLFSTFLTNPAGVQEGLVGSIRYWLSQQPVGRGGQPWFYYLILLPAYEWPLVLFGLIGVVTVVRRPTLAGVFLVWMLGSSLAIYSWASERMPWLVLHPLLPLVLLAGIGAQTLWRARRAPTAKVALFALALGSLTSVWAAVAVSYVRPADPRELLVQVQTSNDVPGIRNELVRLESLVRHATGRPLPLEVDTWGGTGWPWGWYLRDLPVLYVDMSHTSYVPSAQAILVADPNHAAVAPRLDGYVGRRFRLRVWWVPDWGRAGPNDWLRWMVSRRTWSPTASMDEWLYLRPRVARLLNRN